MAEEAIELTVEVDDDANSNFVIVFKDKSKFVTEDDGDAVAEEHSEEGVELVTIKESDVDILFLHLSVFKLDEEDDERLEAEVKLCCNVD
jgi:hypothetical protein